MSDPNSPGPVQFGRGAFNQLHRLPADLRSEVEEKIRELMGQLEVLRLDPSVQTVQFGHAMVLYYSVSPTLGTLTVHDIAPSYQGLGA